MWYMYIHVEKHSQIKQILKRLKVKNDLGNRFVVDARLANLEPLVPTPLLLCAVTVLLCAVMVLSEELTDALVQACSLPAYTLMRVWRACGAGPRGHCWSCFSWGNRRDTTRRRW